MPSPGYVIGLALATSKGFALLPRQAWHSTRPVYGWPMSVITLIEP